MSLILEHEKLRLSLWLLGWKVIFIILFLTSSLL